MTLEIFQSLNNKDGDTQKNNNVIENKHPREAHSIES